jgi:hypothetical protein
MTAPHAPCQKLMVISRDGTVEDTDCLDEHGNALDRAFSARLFFIDFDGAYLDLVHEVRDDEHPMRINAAVLHEHLEPGEIVVQGVVCRRWRFKPTYFRIVGELIGEAPHDDA